jgi:hypothetical protein
MTWSCPAATLCQAVDQLIIEPNEAGLIISFVEVAGTVRLHWLPP